MFGTQVPSGFRMVLHARAQAAIQQNVAQIKQQGIKLATTLESAQTANATLTEALKRADG